MAVLQRPKRYMDMAEAVMYAREQGLDWVTTSTVKKAAYYGSKPLRRSKIGGRVYFELEDVESWIASCKVGD